VAAAGGRAFGTAVGRPRWPRMRWITCASSMISYGPSCVPAVRAMSSKRAVSQVFKSQIIDSNIDVRAGHGPGRKPAVRRPAERIKAPGRPCRLRTYSAAGLMQATLDVQRAAQGRLSFTAEEGAHDSYPSSGPVTPLLSPLLLCLGPAAGRDVPEGPEGVGS